MLCIMTVRQGVVVIMSAVIRPDVLESIVAAGDHTHENVEVRVVDTGFCCYWMYVVRSLNYQSL